MNVTLTTATPKDLRVKLRMVFDGETGKGRSGHYVYFKDKYPIVNASVEEVNQLLIERGELPITIEGDEALLPATLVGRLVQDEVCTRAA